MMMLLDTAAGIDVDNDVPPHDAQNTEFYLNTIM